MTIRETSIAAYAQLVESKQLVGKQRQVMAALIERGRATSGEVLADLAVTNTNAWRARFTELAARGMIREVGERRCEITGRLCIVWEATNRTKPLDRARGARRTDLWRVVAHELAEELAQFTPEPSRGSALIKYRRLVRQR